MESHRSGDILTANVGDDISVMKEMTKEIQQRIESVRSTHHELISSLQTLVPDLVSSLDTSLELISAFNNRPFVPTPNPNPPKESASPTISRNTNLRPSADSKFVSRHSAEFSFPPQQSSLISFDDSLGENRLSVVRTMVAVCLLERVPFTSIDSTAILRKIEGEKSSSTDSEKAALIDLGGESGTISAVETALRYIAEENSGVELDEFTVSGKTRIMVLGIDRNRLLKELPETAQQQQMESGVGTDNQSQSMAISGVDADGGLSSLMPQPSPDAWMGPGSDPHMSGMMHMYHGGGPMGPIMGIRGGPRGMGLMGMPRMMGMPPLHRQSTGQCGSSPVLPKPKSEEDDMKDLEVLLSKKSFRELQKSKTGEELLDLIHRPTARETAVAAKFKTKGGSQLKEYCTNLTKEDCRRQTGSYIACEKVHFRRIIAPHTDMSLGDCKARKLNPDASFIEIEKAFNKKKNKKKKGGSAENDEPVEVPLDWAVEKQNEKKERQQQQLQQNEEQLQQLQKLSSSMGLRAPSRGGNVNFSPKLNLTRPENVNFSKDSSVEEDDPPVTTNLNSDLDLQSSGKGVSGPNISLRKPEVVKGDDIELEKPRFQIKPNIQLKMRKGGHDEELGEVNLLKKPAVVKISLGSPGDNNISETNSKISADKSGKPVSSTSYDVKEQSDVESLKVESGISENFNLNSVQEDHESTPKPANLIGKPQRMDSLPKELPHPLDAKISTPNDAVKYDASDEFLVSSEQEEKEEGDWQRAKDLLQTGDRVEVEFISGSKRGLVVSFGSLVGFLPYRNLGAKWKFLAFESWLRKRGLDPSLYRRNLSIVSNYPVQNQDLSSSSNESQDQEKVIGEKLGSEMKFEDLLEQYDQEKTKFLSSFVGQRTKVVVTMVDQKSRRLMFSGRPKEKEEEVEKKRSVMAKLSVGDIVKCCIKKITYFGIFVEIEGAPALIHQSEVSWDTALDPNDPTSSFKIGQMIDAKVHQLDYVLERITLSLKEITPDPLRESLESVIEDGIEASQKDVEWADVESLIRELEQIEGVAVVSKGRFFLSPGLAPTFQVYMASMHENRYKLLARFENKVQEVIVQTSLDKDEMKSAILTCTNKFEV